MNVASQKIDSRIRRAVAATAFALVATGAGSASATTVNVTPSNGITLSQVSFDMSGGAQASSGYGLCSVNTSQMTSSTGISQGYLNIYDPDAAVSPDNWIVRNLPIDTASAQAGMSTMFDLGVNPGTFVGGLNLQASFSDTPTLSYAGNGINTPYGVGTVLYNAEGKTTATTAPPAATNRPSPAQVTFGAGGTSLTWQTGHDSIEQDKNQCGPASVTNSLSYLRNRYGAAAPLSNGLSNIPGIGGAVEPAGPPKSLVAQLDKAMNRTPHQALNDKPFMNGKLSFIDDPANGLKGKLNIKHWPGAGGGGGVNDTHGNQLVGSTFSTDASVGGGKEIDWIIQELNHGEDVEMSWNWAGNGGHWVDLIGGGYILGVPWVSWVHDAKQGFNDNGTPANIADDFTALNGGTSFLEGGIGFSFVDGQNLLPTWVGSGNSKAKLDLAVSESVPEPTLIGVASIALLSSIRRRRS